MVERASGWIRDTLVPCAVAGLAVILLLGTAGLVGYRVLGMGGDAPGANETLRFIALLIIFMVALAATAALFVSLRMGDATEAFGLPSGSIRALLALGIMILFVVFGMPIIDPRPDPIQPMRFAVPYEQLNDTIRMNQEQGFRVQILNPGAAGPPSRPALVRIVGKAPSQSAAQLDLTKQLLTAIITLLTTVIGFYFGSRSTSEAMRDAAGSDPAPPAEMRRTVDEGFNLVKAQLAAAAETIERWNTDATTATNEGRKAALARIATQRAELEGKRDEITHELAEAAAALAAAATGEDRSRQEAAARSHLRNAGTALAFLQAALGAYTEAVRAIS